jgi:hypothetical protein
MRRIQILACCLVLCIGTVAQAAVHMSDLLNQTATARLSDNSLDVLWNVDGMGGYLAPGAGDTTLDDGDRLITIARIDQLTIPFPGGTTYTFPADWDNEFTLVSVIEVDVKTGGGAGVGPATWTFMPASTADPLGLGWAAGTMVATYDDPGNDFSGAPASIAAGIAEAGPGTAYWEFGFIGEAGEAWFASALDDDLATLGSLPAGTAGGFFSFLINETALNSAPDVIDSSAAPDIVGSGGLVSPGPPFPNPALGGYQLVDNVDVTIRVTPIPEPASMLTWLALSTLVSSLAYRRSR